MQARKSSLRLLPLLPTCLCSLTMLGIRAIMIVEEIVAIVTMTKMTMTEMTMIVMTMKEMTKVVAY